MTQNDVSQINTQEIPTINMPKHKSRPRLPRNVVIEYSALFDKLITIYGITLYTTCVGIILDRLIKDPRAEAWNASNPSLGDLIDIIFNHQRPFSIQHARLVIEINQVIAPVTPTVEPEIVAVVVEPAVVQEQAPVPSAPLVQEELTLTPEPKLEVEIKAKPRKKKCGYIVYTDKQEKELRKILRESYRKYMKKGWTHKKIVARASRIALRDFGIPIRKTLSRDAGGGWTQEDILRDVEAHEAKNPKRGRGRPPKVKAVAPVLTAEQAKELEEFERFKRYQQFLATLPESKS